MKKKREGRKSDAFIVFIFKFITFFLKNSTSIRLRWFRWEGINCSFASACLVAGEGKVDVRSDFWHCYASLTFPLNLLKEIRKSWAVLLASQILLSWSPDLLRDQVVQMLSEINMSLSSGYIFFPAFCRAQTFFSSAHVSPTGISISFILLELLLPLFPVGGFFTCFVQRAASQNSSPWPGFLSCGV